MEDTKIVELYWQRDQAAIGETEKKYGGSCRGIAYGILENSEDCEECVDDSYMAVWNSVPPQRPLRFPAYLFRIVRNLSFDRIRECLAQKRGGGEKLILLDEVDELLASEQSVERECELKELTEAINSFLRTLSRDDRIIFTYRYWLALPTAEIAKRFCFKESKAHMSLHRSRKKLREYLLKEGLV